MEELLKEWETKFNKLYESQPKNNANYTDLDWQNDGRITELNNCIIQLRYAIKKKCDCEIADMRNEVIESGYMCVKCGKLYKPVDH